MYKSILSLFTLLLLTSCTNGQNTSKKTNLTAVEFSKKIQELEQPQLIDVRTPKEFEGGHLENAVNIDWNGNDFMTHISSLDKSKPVMVYCLSGGRSAAAANAMRENGFKQVYEMDGGMMQWRSKNLPETTENTVSKSMTVTQYETLLDSDKLVLIDFYAEWCAPCKKMEPYLNKISEDSSDKVVIVRIDADKNRELCKDLNVSALPVLKLYKNKQLIWENLGFIEENEVRKQLNN
jgi:thioredoxin 1